jgi:hypothetical protein
MTSWKAVALMPRDDAARERGSADTRVADATIFLARYDRQVADVFLAQALHPNRVASLETSVLSGRSSGRRRLATRRAPWHYSNRCRASPSLQVRALDSIV